MPGLPPFEAVISQRTLEFDGGKVWPPADRRRITFQGKLTASLKRIFPLEIRQQQYQKLEKENFCLYNCPNIIINKITARWNHHKSFELQISAPLTFWVPYIFQAWNQNLFMKYPSSDPLFTTFQAIGLFIVSDLGKL